MRYNIDSVIKRLQEAKDKGKTLVDEVELIRIASHRINDIDGQIKRVDSGIRKYKEQNKNYSYNTSFSEAEDLTGIPRRTFYRWKKEGILFHCIRNASVLNLIELRDTLVRIKQVKK